MTKQDKPASERAGEQASTTKHAIQHTWNEMPPKFSRPPSWRGVAVAPPRAPWAPHHAWTPNFGMMRMAQMDGGTNQQRQEQRSNKQACNRR
eukprot:CAMPEP_0204576916 /NCGR_PEP_ID=MMETSP0661-20131031/42052_1 /ASSEMBLY_ACC=CAM_ASM_000606 /TAXON_ID=109239 /ORGANISM="Alexandrium margalefi, Strain AMGDE01CS-322" /LENGTH=91 /DNA_ID=CAMNT_0051585713 /DNA_START=95 /DNA_END=366 /DNA_ORIENTATION=-